MRFATIGMALTVAIFAACAFLLPEARMPGITTEAERLREDVAAARSSWVSGGATLPGHDLFLGAYYVCLAVYAIGSSAVGARLLFRRHRGGRARAILVACNFPLLLAVCAAIYQSRYLHFMSQMPGGTHLWYVHQMRFSLLAGLIAAALPAIFAGLALRLAPAQASKE